MAWRWAFGIALVTLLMVNAAIAHEMIALSVPTWAKRQLDISYAPSSPAQRLDLYWPQTGPATVPLIIAIHGGGFRGGDKRSSELDPMITALSHGYAVAAVNYRLSAEARFPAAVTDIKAAIRYLRAHAGALGLDPARFAVWGASAGGNLAAMMATTSGYPLFDDPTLGNGEVSSAVQAAVDWYGPVDFAAIGQQYGTDTGKKAVMDSFVSQYLGAAPDLVPTIARAAAPGTYVTPTMPPILIEHGGSDSLVPVDQSRDLAARVAHVAGQARVTFVVLEGAEHSDPAFGHEETLRRVYRFLNSGLNNP